MNDLTKNKQEYVKKQQRQGCQRALVYVERVISRINALEHQEDLTADDRMMLHDSILRNAEWVEDIIANYTDEKLEQQYEHFNKLS